MAQIQMDDAIETVRPSRLALVVARFNETITRALLEGALDELKRADISQDIIDVHWVPGAFELPVAAKKLCQTKRYDALICLGAVIRGETPHFDYVCENACRGLAEVGREFTLPIINGVLTVNNEEQARSRCGLGDQNGQGHLGRYSARGALQMIHLFQKIHDDS